MINLKTIFSIFLLMTILIFNGCSSKYQTNSIPKEEKLIFPTEYDEKKYYLDEDKKEEFKRYVIREFNNGVDERRVKSVVGINENTSETKGLWQKGYEIDRKRY